MKEHCVGWWRGADCDGFAFGVCAWVAVCHGEDGGGVAWCAVDSDGVEIAICAGKHDFCEVGFGR